MNYGKIIYFDTANARGLSTVLFVSGCENYCENCQNKETWDFNYGEPFTKEVENKIISSLKLPYVKNLVISGGDPCNPKNIDTIINFVLRVRKEVGDKIKIIVYTGYTFEDLYSNIKYYNLFTQINYLIDGKYNKNLPTKGLDYRGSTNQRCFLFDFTKTELRYIDISSTYFKEVTNFSSSKQILAGLIEED